MKLAHKQLFAAALLASAGLAAIAQTPAPHAGPGAAMAHRGDESRDPAKMQERMARMQERMAKHLAEFKQKLQITPAQEGSWNSYTAALKPAANLQRPDRAELAKLPTPERIDRMRAIHTARMAEMDKRADATKAFYATLTPAQQKTFDEETARRGHHGKGGHHGRHHRG